jgi:muramoyltetrapeptide carboxypeptidase
MTIIPPYLKPGDTIGITCPAGYMELKKAEACIKTLQQWGFEVMLGKTIGSKSKNYFSGTDEERRDELQAMLDDRSIKAVLFGRGGYGTGRIIDTLNFKKFVKHPKWLIGFSDITVLHAHVNSNHKIATIHGPMTGAFNLHNGASKWTEALHHAIVGKKANYSCKHYKNNKQGIAKGKLIGGNLALLSNVIGTASDFETKNRILFIEDLSEYLYSADRMLHQLKRSGKLKSLAGLIVGGFTEMKDTERPFGKSIENMIKDIVEEYDYPVCYHFPISHANENLAVKVGVEYELKITKQKTVLKEL